MRRAALAVAVAALAVAATASAQPASDASGSAASRARAQRTITMSGSVIVQALMADLAYFYRHAVAHPPRFSLVGGVTGTGIADAERGVSDAGMVSRELIPADPSDLVLTRLALSGVCLVTNRANPVPGITRAQVQDVVAGRVTSWSQIPGSSRTDPIVPVGIDPTSGAAQVFQTVFVDLDTPLVYRPVTLAADTQLRDYVEQTPAALGYSDLALTKPLHVMAFDGVACTRATIRAGTYPARRPLGVVTRGRPRGALKRFLRWARTSRLARRVISSRYLPG
jgi:phosphate transport system substrate-binding protein